jgi:4-amino-4-deoxy-L-arabinose transferase-like glycosyltransferase
MNKYLLPLIAIAIFTSFFKLGSVKLFDVDEAVFAEATKEMVESGNWITPTYNGENRYDKPILFYWLMVPSYKLFGINEFAARFPSAITALLLAISTFFFVRHFYTDREAFYAAISLVTSVYFLVYSHAAVTDMALTFFIALSIFSFYLSMTEKGNLYLYGFYAFSAFAFLTKGLIGIIFPFGISVFYLSITEGPSGIKKIFSLKGVILFLVISAPWYIAQFAINGEDFFNQFFIKHHLERYTGVISGHRGPVYYFIPSLIIGLFPWIVFLPTGIRNALIKRRSSEPAGYGLNDPGFSRSSNSLLLLALIWFAFIVIFFSLSKTKLPNYVLPAIPAASLLISSGMSGQNRQIQYADVFIGIFSALIGTAFLISREYFLKAGIHDTNWTFAAAAIMLAMAILSFYGSLKRKNIYTGLICLMIAFLFVLSAKALPIANQYLQGTLYKYSLYAKEKLHPGEKIITYKINNPSIVFYSGHKIIKADNKDKLSSIIKNTGEIIAITNVKNNKVLIDSGFTLLDKDERYALFERK